jgi:hypothetical protein
MLYFMISVLIVFASCQRLFADPFSVPFDEKPEHAVLIVIDGLSYKAWDKMELPVLDKMIETGTLVEKNYLPPAAHPLSGEYAELHTCSIPNPIMMAGTVFITKKTKYLQQSFYPDKITAFVSPPGSYVTISNYYHYVYQNSKNDDDGIQMALEFMKLRKPSFMRVHLQDTGGAGTESMTTEKNVDWRSNIWATDSPYRKAVSHADSLIGVFLKDLEKQGVLDKTVFIIMGDHGQHDTGWHPLEYIDSSITTIVLWGAGIKKGVRIPYSEHIDVVPTICALMGVKPPETSQGRIIAEALSQYRGEIKPRRLTIKELDELFIEYREKMADVSYKLETINSGKQGYFFSQLNREVRERFYDINKFSEWPRFDSLEAILEHDRTVMKMMDDVIKEINAVQ